MSQSQTESTTVTVRRILRIAPQRVFDCWTQPEHLANWFRPEPQLSTSLAEVDLRVGGRYRLGIRDAEKDVVYVVSGSFKEINPPRKLSFTWDWENEGMSGIDSLVTVDFRPHGDGETEIVLTHFFADASHAGHHEQGWHGCLQQLATLLEV